MHASNHQCQVGCTDVHRLCWRPRALANAELDAGATLPGIRQAQDNAEAYLAAPNARRPWMKAMLLLRAIPHRTARNACEALFERQAGALAAMPPVY